MRRGTANAVVDAALLVVFVPTLASSLVLFFVLPSGGGRGATFLSVPRSTWETMHDYTGLLFIALLVLHLVLHYRYLRHLNRHLAGPREPTAAGE